MKFIIGQVKIVEQLVKNYKSFATKYKTCQLEVTYEGLKTFLKITSQANPSVFATLDLVKFDFAQEHDHGLVLRFQNDVRVVVKECTGARRLNELIQKEKKELEKANPVSNMGSVSLKKGSFTSGENKKKCPLAFHEPNVKYIMIGQELTKIPLRKRKSDSMVAKSEVNSSMVNYGTTSLNKEDVDNLPLVTREEAALLERRRQRSKSQDEKPERTFSTSTPKLPNKNRGSAREQNENYPYTHVKKRRISVENRHKENMDTYWQNDCSDDKENKSSEKKSAQKGFLEKAEEKSKLFENNSSSWSSKSFYKSGCDAGERMHGSFGLSSDKSYTKKRPFTFTKPGKYSLTANSSTGASSQVLLRGFSNLGNTCYMNSILQSLFALESFSKDLAFLQDQTRRLEHCHKYLFFLLANLKEAQEKKLVTEAQNKCLNDVKQAISAKRFSGKEQHDAHEFLSQVIDQVKEETTKENKAVDREEKGSGDAVKHDIDKDTYLNPTILNFEFQVLHTITCLKCGSVVKKTEVFHDLSIDLPKRINSTDTSTLQDALNQFFKTEKRDYTCEKCEHKQVEVSHTFYRAPRVVVLQLKRYRFDTVTTQHRKLARSIGIPRYITLSDYCSHDTIAPYITDVTTFYKIKRDALCSTENRKKGASPNLLDFSMKSETGSKKITPMQQPPQMVIDSDLEEDFPGSWSNTSTKKHQEDDVLDQSSYDVFTTGMSEDAQIKIAMERSLTDQHNDTFETPISWSDPKNSEAKPRSSITPKSSPRDKTPVKQKHTMYTPYLTLSSDSEAEPAEQITPIREAGVERKREEAKDLKSGAEPDWLIAKNREAQDLEKAMALSLKESTIVPSLSLQEKEAADLSRALELSLKDVGEDGDELNESFLEEEPLVRATQSAEMHKNSKDGHLPYSYRLVSIVSHFGSSDAGHYISDVYNSDKDQWFSYDDKNVTQMSEDSVLQKRQQTGYIFFYVDSSTLMALEAKKKDKKSSFKENISPSATKAKDLKLKFD